MSIGNIFQILSLDPEKTYRPSEIRKVKDERLGYLSKFNDLDSDKKRKSIFGLDENAYSPDVQKSQANAEQARLLSLEQEFNQEIGLQVSLLETNTAESSLRLIAATAFAWPAKTDLGKDIFLKYILKTKLPRSQNLDQVIRKSITDFLKALLQKRGLVIVADSLVKQPSLPENFSTAKLIERDRDLKGVGKSTFYEFLHIQGHSFPEIRKIIDAELKLVTTPKYTKGAKELKDREILFCASETLASEKEKKIYDREIEYAKLLPLLPGLDVCRTTKSISGSQFNTVIELGLKLCANRSIVEEFIYAVAAERKYSIERLPEELRCSCKVCGFPSTCTPANNARCKFCNESLMPVPLSSSARNNFRDTENRPRKEFGKAIGGMVETVKYIAAYAHPVKRKKTFGSLISLILFLLLIFLKVDIFIVSGNSKNSDENNKKSDISPEPPRPQNGLFSRGTLHDEGTKLVMSSHSPEELVRKAKEWRGMSGDGPDAAYRAAEAAGDKGNVEGMLIAASYFDPTNTEPSGTYVKDPQAAWEWYARAEEAGSQEAKKRLANLFSWARRNPDSAVAKEFLELHPQR